MIKMTKTYRKLLNICFVSSDAFELAKLMKAQYTAAQAAHFIYKNMLNNFGTGYVNFYSEYIKLKSQVFS